MYLEAHQSAVYRWDICPCERCGCGGCAAGGGGPDDDGRQPVARGQEQGRGAAGGEARQDWGHRPPCRVRQGLRQSHQVLVTCRLLCLWLNYVELISIFFTLAYYMIWLFCFVILSFWSSFLLCNFIEPSCCLIKRFLTNFSFSSFYSVVLEYTHKTLLHYLVKKLN